MQSRDLKPELDVVLNSVSFNLEVFLSNFSPINIVDLLLLLPFLGLL
jgi:hypothetical protein